MRNPDLIGDTLPEADSVLIRLLREKRSFMRLQAAVEASNGVAEQCKNAIRRRHPHISDFELKLRFIELNYGQAIAGEVRAYLNNQDEP